VKSLSSEARRALVDRVQFYRELGIYDFYRQPLSPGNPSQAAGLRPSAATDTSAMNADAALALREVAAADGRQPTATRTNPELPILSSQDRITALEAIRADIGECTRCRLHKGRTNLVFGVGNPNADLMFVGEGPGADEDHQGEPFVGRGGQLLNNMIAAMGLKRQDVYIANIVKCRPPQNRAPERDEADTCAAFLMRQISVIQPKAIVALGATAAKNLLGLNDSMSNLRGHAYDFIPRGSSTPPIKLFVTYHPAFLLRDPRQKKETWKDLQQVMRYLNLPLPPKSSTRED
jgi:DNA polymerase